MENITSQSRRDFIKTTAAVSGGLAVGFHLAASPRIAEAAVQSYMPNAWVRIGADNSITIMCARSEMGQSVYTTMPQLVCEELEVGLDKIKVEIAPPGEAYINELLGGQLTGGSTSVRDGYEKLRKAGATVRTMLISAAAQKWKVDPSTCHAESGVVICGNKRATYGQLAAAASALPVPKDVKLKSEKDFKLVGKAVKRLDTPWKTNGQAEFGIDVKLPGMLYASLAQSPVLKTGKVKNFDATAAKAMPGVVAVVQIDDGVAVVANSFYRAKKARDALKIEWDEGANAGLNQQDIRAAIAKASAAPGAVVRKEGDAAAAIAGAAKKFEAVYETPFQSHSPMEPMNFTADVRPDSAHLYGPIQFQQIVPPLVAKITGLPLDKITLHTTFLGGGFGRRIDTDFMVQATQISKAIGKPVKLVWTREDDMTHDFYRPLNYTKVSCGLDGNGRPVGWKFDITGPSISSRLFPVIVKDGVDPFSVEGAHNYPYDVANVNVNYLIHDTGIAVGYWRSVSHSLNCFAVEGGMDEAAALAGKDPWEYRRSLLAKQPRYLAVLDTAAQRADWGKPLPAGHGRGIALMEGYDTFMAQVAEVSVEGGKIKVHRVVVAVDCGRAINPNTVEAQIEGSIVFGMQAAMFGEITLKNGRVEQNNFDTFPVPRITDMPKVEVHLMPSNEKPGGIGEPAVGLIGPAIANAVFAATGKRLRRLPLTVA
jgi:isoquinoline 1-oxidoreductase subunit beta